MASLVADAILQRVRDQYEEFPYPDYPLFARPRWQEGILGGSAFAQCLAGSPQKKPGSTLIAGCGDMQPYILRKVENPQQQVYCVDLSSASLRKAQQRMALWQISRLKAPFSKTTFCASSVESFLTENPDLIFDHIEAYGVLHHLANPSDSVAMLASRLRPGGTMRVMVYNQQAREWIRRIKRIFQLLRLSPFGRGDLKVARAFLRQAALYYPRLGQRLEQMGSHCLTHDARFVDAFFQQREIKFSYQVWDALWRSNALTPLGLLDRYCELDHLPNPLWQIPSLDQVNEAINEGLFYHNFEIYLKKTGGLIPQATGQSARLSHPLSAPPSLWFSYSETNEVKRWQRWHLWQCFQRGLSGQSWYQGDVKSLGSMMPDSLKRLARLGGILPSFISNEHLASVLLSPIGEKVTDDCEAIKGPDSLQPFTNYLENMINKKRLNREERRMRLITSHLEAII